MKPTMEFFVAGLIYGDFEPAKLKLAKGDVVELKREPTNLVDPNAVLVRCDDKKLGYVPKGLNGLPMGQAIKAAGGKMSTNAATSNQGKLWHAAVINFAPTNPTHRMVLVGIFPGPAPVRVVEPVVPGKRRLILS